MVDVLIKVNPDYRAVYPPIKAGIFRGGWVDIGERPRLVSIMCGDIMRDRQLNSARRSLDEG